MPRPKPTPPTLVLLVRHGQTPTTGKHLPGRTPGLHLSEEGQRQAELAAKRIAELKKVDAIYASPLERAQETAAPIAASCGLEVQPESGLLECDFGEWEGLTFREVRERYPAEVETWLGSTAAAPPGGESLDAVAARVDRAVERLRAYGSGVVVVVSHVSALKLILREALAAGDAFLYRCHLDPAGMSTVDMWPDGGVSVRSVNETAHL